METSASLVDYAIELLGPFGTVSARAMFGGHGIYLDGVLFAIVSQETLWLKADTINRSEFEAAGCRVFSYVRSGKTVTMSFFEAPAAAMESPQAMMPWARSAYAAALRSNAKRRAMESRLSAARARGTSRASASSTASAGGRAAPAATRLTRSGRTPTRTARKSRRERRH
jgi:DNA transformation protein